MNRLLLLAGLCSVGAAWAGDDAAIVLGGTEVSSSNTYTQAGMIMPLPGNTVRQGWHVPVFVSDLSYNYKTLQNGQSVQVRATVPGVRAGMGYQWLVDNTDWGVSVSLGYQNTRQQPYIPATGKQGAAWIVLPQAGVRSQFLPQWDVDVLANYALGQHAYWSRGRLGYQARWDWRGGLELGAQAGSNYRILKRGLFVATPVWGGAMLEMNAGLQSNIDFSNQGYWGLAVSRSW